MEKNRVYMIGQIDEPLVYSHKNKNEKIFKTMISVTRTSGTIDRIPLMIPERLIDPKEDYTGIMVEISGKLHSWDKEEDGKNHLLLSLFAEKMWFPEFNCEETNEIELTGNICRKPDLRITPKGRKICRILLAIDRHKKKTDYIPCVVWEENVTKAVELQVGTKVNIFGRVQSREYRKCGEIKTTHEVSGKYLEVL